jgi:8-oxo-dGTP pyrophosphatase MutT (NUDIX family)
MQDKFNTRIKKICSFKFYDSNFNFDIEKVTSVWIFAFNENNEIVCIELDRWIDIPGWHLKNWETPIEALKRECLEEAYVEIKDIEIIKVVHSDYFWEDNPTYMLFYIWKIDKVFDFQKNEESSERYFLKPNDFLEKYSWDKEFIKNIYDKIL